MTKKGFGDDIKRKAKRRGAGFDELTTNKDQMFSPLKKNERPSRVGGKRNKKAEVLKQAETVKYSTRLNRKQLERLQYIHEQTGLPVTRLIGEALHIFLNNTMTDEEIEARRQAALRLGRMLPDTST